MLSVIYEGAVGQISLGFQKAKKLTVFHGLLLMQVPWCRSYAAILPCTVAGQCCSQYWHANDADGTVLCAQRSAESERSFSHSLDADASGHISRPAATYVAPVCRCSPPASAHHTRMLCT